MNAVNKARIAARDGKIDHNAVCILPAQFDALSWIKWAESLDSRIERTPGGICIGMPMSDESRSESQQRQWLCCMAALNGDDPNDLKIKALGAFFDGLFPEIKAGHELSERALKIVHQYAVDLPVVWVATSLRAGVPIYAATLEDVPNSSYHSAEWVEKKTAELRARQAEWEADIADTADQMKHARLQNAWQSFGQAKAMEDEANTLMNRGFKAQAIWRSTLKTDIESAPRKTKKAA